MDALPRCCGVRLERPGRAGGGAGRRLPGGARAGRRHRGDGPAPLDEGVPVHGAVHRDVVALDSLEQLVAVDDGAVPVGDEDAVGRLAQLLRYHGLEVVPRVALFEVEDHLFPLPAAHDDHVQEVGRGWWRRWWRRRRRGDFHLGTNGTGDAAH